MNILRPIPNARLIAFAMCLGVALIASAAQAKVFFSKQGALEAAFPGASKVEHLNVFLTESDAASIKARAGVEWPGRIASVYAGYQGGTLLGYAVIDTHRVRTLNETVMIVVSPAGTVARTELLAFHEPEEYMATARWRAQFTGRHLDDRLSLRGDIDGITGATLTARTTTAAVRRVLALTLLERLRREAVARVSTAGASLN